MGFDFITGPELIEKFQYQLIHSHYVDHLISEVEKIEHVEGGFYVTTSELNKYFAKTLIIAYDDNPDVFSFARDLLRADKVHRNPEGRDC